MSYKPEIFPWISIVTELFFSNSVVVTLKSFSISSPSIHKNLTYSSLRTHGLRYLLGERLSYVLPFF